MGTANVTHAEVVSEGRAVAWCDIDTDPDAVREARVRLTITAGHLPVGVRREIVDRVLDYAADSGVDRLRLALPLGDSELIRLLHERCWHVEARSAGATCLIDAELVQPRDHTSQRREQSHAR